MREVSALPQRNSLAQAPRREDNRIARVDLLAIVRLAITSSGVPFKVIAADLDVDGPYLTRMLTGEKPFPLSKLSQLPTPVFETFRALLTEFDQRAVGQAFLMLGRAMLRIPRLPERAEHHAKADLT